MSSAATRATQSSSSTSKIKTADSSRSCQYDDEAKLIGITVQEYPLNVMDVTFSTTPRTPKTNATFSERAVPSRDGDPNNRLRIEMQQTVELTSLSITPEEKARAQNDSVLPAPLRRNGEASVMQDPAPAVVPRISSASPSASATATTTVTAQAPASASAVVID